MLYTIGYNTRYIVCCTCDQFETYTVVYNKANNVAGKLCFIWKLITIRMFIILGFYEYQNLHDDQIIPTCEGKIIFN